jgi:hypothetical protein
MKKIIIGLMLLSCFLGCSNSKDKELKKLQEENAKMENMILKKQVETLSAISEQQARQQEIKSEAKKQAEQQYELAQLIEKQNQKTVFWTNSGIHLYHLYLDCYRLNSKKTDKIFSGPLTQAELSGMTELCSTCEDRAKKEIGSRKSN